MRTSARAHLDETVEGLLDLPQDATAADVAQAHNRVVLAGLFLAESIARRYRGRGADVEDLLPVANLGLVKAAKGYRVGSPAGFCAYAIPTIAGEIKRHFRDFQWIVRPPRALTDLQRAVSECRQRLTQLHGRHPSDREIAHTLEISPECVRAVRLSAAAYRPASDDVLADLPVPTDDFDQVLDRLTVGRLLEAIEPREARLLQLRFAEGRSQASIALELGISQMQVSRLLSALLNRLRRCA
ncbi:MAG: sigma-70 family RNA polymerase sigma factor [Propionibacteriaceae bacterium]|nr:sigma-70 family RNA polymerase sigma factor [Propionibacteriaceae bacterium]